jgi:hypothetical protein
MYYDIAIQQSAVWVPAAISPASGPPVPNRLTSA